VTGRRLRDGFVAALLRSPVHRFLSGSLLLITVTGRRSGKQRTLPVMYAEDEGGLIIFVGHAQTKAWWRNLSAGAAVRVRMRDLEYEAQGDVVRHDPSLAARYLERFPKARKAVGETNDPVFVRVRALRPTG
jgi:deazaflavin-dependent oxidoreductase (nitroreductase family)